MSRRIITEQLQATGAGGAGKEVDGYFDRLVKYIPADVVGLWLVGVGLINTFFGTAKAVIMIVFFVICLGITVWWTHDQTKETKTVAAKTQITVAAFAFVVWVIALQGTEIHDAFPWYKPAVGSLLLLVYSTVVARKVPAE
jgi:uncharacterized membrane protein YwzB